VATLKNIVQLTVSVANTVDVGGVTKLWFGVGTLRSDAPGLLLGLLIEGCAFYVDSNETF